MTGLDTNVLLGWLLAGQARELPGEPPYRLGHIVLVELVWVLARGLGKSRKEIASVLATLLATRELRIADPDLVDAAIEDYARGKGDFADYLIARENLAAGCVTTFTLDRNAAKHPGFTLLKGTDG